MNKEAIIAMVVIVGLAALWGLMNGNFTGNTAMNENQGNTVVFETTQGVIKLQLYDDMPTTTENFKKLVSEGFYDGVLFHRVIDGFMIQGGDPLTKDETKKDLWGTGGSDPIKDEFAHAGGNKNNRATISMANAGPNTGSSQFFINLVNNNFLDTKHPAFGEVIEGMNVVDVIGKSPTDEADRPREEVKITRAYLE